MLVTVLTSRKPQHTHTPHSTRPKRKEKKSWKEYKNITIIHILCVHGGVCVYVRVYGGDHPQIVLSSSQCKLRTRHKFVASRYSNILLLLTLYVCYYYIIWPFERSPDQMSRCLPEQSNANPMLWSKRTTDEANMDENSFEETTCCTKRPKSLSIFLDGRKLSS